MSKASLTPSDVTFASQLTADETIGESRASGTLERLLNVLPFRASESAQITAAPSASVLNQPLQPHRSVLIVDPTPVDERLQNLPCPDIHDEEGPVDIGNPTLQISVISLDPTISSTMSSTVSTATVFGGADDEAATRLRKVRQEIYNFAKATETEYKSLAAQAPDDNAVERQNVDEKVDQIVNKTFHFIRESVDALNASEILDADGLAKAFKALEAFRKSVLKRVHAMPPLCDTEDMESPTVSQATVDEWKKAVAKIENEVKVDTPAQVSDEIPLGGEATSARGLRLAARLASSTKRRKRKASGGASQIIGGGRQRRQVAGRNHTGH